MTDVGPLVNVGRLMNEFDIKGKQATDGATSFLYLDNPKDAGRIAKDLTALQECLRRLQEGPLPALCPSGRRAACARSAAG